MPATNHLSTDQLREALRLTEQLEQLQQRLDGILGDTEASVTSRTGEGRRSASGRKGNRGSQDAIPSSVGSTGGKAKRIMSPEARARMAAAQKARWAEQEKRGEPVIRPEAIALPKKKGALTAEGRARLAAAMRARWASAKKKGAPAPNAKATT